MTTFLEQGEMVLCPNSLTLFIRVSCHLCHSYMLVANIVFISIKRFEIHFILISKQLQHHECCYKGVEEDCYLHNEIWDLIYSFIIKDDGIEQHLNDIAKAQAVYKGLQNFCHSSKPLSKFGLIAFWASS